MYFGRSIVAVSVRVSGIFGKNLMSALISSCELRVLVSASAQFRLFRMSIGFSGRGIVSDIPVLVSYILIRS